MADHLDTFLTALANSLADNSFVKLTLGNPHGPDPTLRKVLIKAVRLAKGDHLNFVHRHQTKDVTKNVPLAQGVEVVAGLLGSDFWSAHLFTTTNDFELSFDKNRKTRLSRSRPTHTSVPGREHNRSKRRLVAPDSPYLALLGVTKPDGSVKKGMEAKFRQINKFIEIFDGLLRSAPLPKDTSLSVLDMGSGKGYLTFAAHDYLTRDLKRQATVLGVEARQELVDFCNGVAAMIGAGGLSFVRGRIQDFEPGPTDVLIALHACNVATDEALYKGIKARAALILCAPCCHQELRSQLKSELPGVARLLKFGILRERQTELLTDSLRALLLEAHGYKTSVFEFISTEHTSKNVMIAAVRAPRSAEAKAAALR
jgi:SAM-dependent methyltransferase